MAEARRCSVCGKEFLPSKKHRTICSETCKKKQKRKDAEQKPKKKVNQELVEMAVKARKAGMTYGQYTALEYLKRE